MSIDTCQKDNWRGRCCCNCKHHVAIKKHPWNIGEGKGTIIETMGYGCAVPDFDLEEDGARQIVFFSGYHGMCEMHEIRQPTIQDVPTNEQNQSSTLHS